MKVDVTKAMWIGAFLISTLLYVIIVAHYEGRIAQTDFETTEARATLARDTKTVAEEAQLLGVKQAALDDIARITPQADESHLTAAAFREFRRIAAAHHIASFKMTLTPPTVAATPAPRRTSAAQPGTTSVAASQATPTPRPRPSAAPKLVTLPITLTLEGQYGDLLNSLEDLSRARVLTQVQNASFQVVRADRKAPRLQLTVTAQLYPPVKFQGGQPIVPIESEPQASPSPTAKPNVVGAL